MQHSRAQPNLAVLDVSSIPISDVLVQELEVLHLLFSFEVDLVKHVRRGAALSSSLVDTSRVYFWMVLSISVKSHVFLLKFEQQMWKRVFNLCLACIFLKLIQNAYVSFN